MHCILLLAVLSSSWPRDRPAGMCGVLKNFSPSTGGDPAHIMLMHICVRRTKKGQKCEYRRGYRKREIILVFIPAKQSRQEMKKFSFFPSTSPLRVLLYPCGLSLSHCGER
uniref:Putative secreted protein n=1 Tax=Anopheles darlingi TaxID=43151 RepID=A0A2M4D0R4_ANODA